MFNRSSYLQGFDILVFRTPLSTLVIGAMCYFAGENPFHLPGAKMKGLFLLRILCAMMLVASWESVKWAPVGVATLMMDLNPIIGSVMAFLLY